MTMTIAQPLRDKIRATSACLADVRHLAGELAQLDAARLESMMLVFAHEGDDHAVSRLLQVSAYNRICLNPDVLCRCVGVCEEMVDSAPCFALQNGDAVMLLLAAAVNDELPLERQLYASRLAAELADMFDCDPQPVRNVLWKQEHAVLPAEYQLLIRQSLDVLEEQPNTGLASPWTDLALKDILPEHKPKPIIGGHYTVRRSVPKLGRNEPCHYGSGKKYKKCCFEKDQDREIAQWMS